MDRLRKKSKFSLEILSQLSIISLSTNSGTQTTTNTEKERHMSLINKEIGDFAVQAFQNGEF